MKQRKRMYVCYESECDYCHRQKTAANFFHPQEANRPYFQVALCEFCLSRALRELKRDPEAT